MAKNTQYKVQTVTGFEAPNRPVSGGLDKEGHPVISLLVPGRVAGSEAYVGELTDEQIKAIKADKYLVLMELDDDGNVKETPDQAQGGTIGSPDLSGVQKPAGQPVSADAIAKDIEESEAANKPATTATDKPANKDS
jgi:hypothetical protein